MAFTMEVNMDNNDPTLELAKAVRSLAEELRGVRAELNGLRRELLSSFDLIADTLQGR